MKVVIACDSFKGSCSSEQVAEAITKGVCAVYPDAQIARVLIADGGEGTMDTLTRALHGEFVHVPAHDALLRPIDSVYGLLPDGTAVLDMAETGGITRLTSDELSPWDATTFGLGEQIVDAAKRGCKKMLIGLGGSATTDGGQGMMQAINEYGADKIQCEIRVLCDVTNPLYGEKGAAYVFSPQKGATPDMVLQLDERLRQIAAASPHPEVALTPGAGAAGGLGFALMCYMNAQLVSGIEQVLACQQFDQLVQDADLVFTGEGKMDSQTLMNKAPLGVMLHAKKYGVPTVGVAGKVEAADQLIAAGFKDVQCINLPNTPLEKAMNPAYAADRLRVTAEQIMKTIG